MSDKPLTTAESMALAVLRGDALAARALCDLLTEEYRQGAVELPPVTRLTADPGRLRAVLYGDAEEYSAGWADSLLAVRRWLSGETTALYVPRRCRLELYELPAPPPVANPVDAPDAPARHDPAADWVLQPGGDQPRLARMREARVVERVYWPFVVEQLCDRVERLEGGR